MSNSSRKPSLLLLFSHGVGLARWRQAGYFEREIGYYKRLSEDLAHVEFATYDRDLVDYSEVAPIRVTAQGRFPSQRIYGLIAPLLRWRTFRNADVVKSNQFAGSWTGVITKWLHRKKFIARCGYVWSLNVERSSSSRSRKTVTKLVEKVVLRQSDVIVVPDRLALDYLAVTHGISEDKFVVIPNFVDTTQFVSAPSEERKNSKFLFVGRLSREKRPELAVEAMKITPDATLDLIGDGPLKKKFEESTSNLANVEIVGRLEHVELSKRTRSARGLVITSQYEGSPKVVIEAMASGLPIIAVKAPGLDYIVRDRENGLLVDPNPESIAEAIKLLMNDQNLWSRLSTRCRELAEQKYSRDGVAKKEIELINSLFGDSH